MEFSLDEQPFEAKASKLLNKLFDALEAKGEEVDMLEDVLYLSREEEGQYVINKHYATQQIWVSSPKSGAHHFRYVESVGQWMNTAGKTLSQFCKDELQVTL